MNCRRCTYLGAYVIEVENGNQEYQLFYDQDGNVLDKRDVSGDKDDTHWPVSKL